MRFRGAHATDAEQACSLQCMASYSRGEFCHDGHHWLSVLCDLFPVGCVLVVNLHLRNYLRCREQLQEISQIDARVCHIAVVLSLLIGDFNSTCVVGTPLASVLGQRSALRPWRRILPPGVPTNFSMVAIHPRQTSIDQVFIRGSVVDATQKAIRTPSSHVNLNVSFTLAAVPMGPYRWRRFR